MKKKIVSFLCIITCFLAVFAGSSCVNAAEKSEGAFDEAELKEAMESFIETWFSYDFQAFIDEYAEQLEEQGMTEEYQGYAKLQERAGEKHENGESTITYNEDKTTAKVEINSVCDGLTIHFSGTYDESMNMTDYAVEEYKEPEAPSIGEVMKTAGLNTFMGMGIVFLVLIFISVVISCFVLISIIQKRGEKKAEAVSKKVESKKVESKKVSTVSDTKSSEDLTDDTELVAVITAAIVAASGSESADGLIVRSIRRRY